MDNSEEYVLQVFRRAQSMLAADVKPEHTAYLEKLGQKFAQTPDLRTEVVCLNFIQGFSKAGIAFEWLLARSKRDTEFSLEQFDTDVQLLYDALLDAFTAETFDPSTLDVSAPVRALPEPNWNAAAQATAAADTMPVTVRADVFDTPSFADLLDHPMLLTVRRLADSATVFDKKIVNERAMSLAVLKMMAKNVVDMARPQNKIVVTGTFQEVAAIMERIERKGLAKDPDVAKTISELGAMISFALHDMTSGIRYMQEISEFIQDAHARLQLT